jgi:hypothetical protein
MKYIKSYENTTELKKYVITELIEYYCLDEITQRDPIELTSKYICNKDSTIIRIAGNHRYDSTNDYLQKHLIYTSNDLQDCLDQFQLYMDSKKYNL